MPKAVITIVTIAAVLTAATTEEASAHRRTVVRRGDTLSRIADRHDVGWRWLYRVNRDRLASPHRLRVGQRLSIPGPAGLRPHTPVRRRRGRAPIPRVWRRLADCESGGRWHINTGNGYYGGLQFSLDSWRWVGGSGYPHRHSAREQVRRAEILQDRQGWGAWPACSRRLGLR